MMAAAALMAARPALLSKPIIPGLSASGKMSNVCDRRAILAASVPIIMWQSAATAAATPTNWGDMLPEDEMPYTLNYAVNALKLADHLEWYASTPPNAEWEAAGEKLKEEVVLFSAIYRRNKYTPQGPMPGLNDLQTSYGALSAHFLRYASQPSGYATPLPEALAGTVKRNAAAASKEIRKRPSALAEGVASSKLVLQ